MRKQKFMVELYSNRLYWLSPAPHTLQPSLSTTRAICEPHPTEIQTFSIIHFHGISIALSAPLSVCVFRCENKGNLFRQFSCPFIISQFHRTWRWIGAHHGVLCTAQQQRRADTFNESQFSSVARSLWIPLEAPSSSSVGMRCFRAVQTVLNFSGRLPLFVCCRTLQSGWF